MHGFHPPPEFPGLLVVPAVPGASVVEDAWMIAAAKAETITLTRFVPHKKNVASKWKGYPGQAVT